jgi:hypothetical protein
MKSHAKVQVPEIKNHYTSYENITAVKIDVMINERSLYDTN